MQGKAGGCNFEGLQFAIQKAHNGAFHDIFQIFKTPLKSLQLRLKGSSCNF